MNNGTTNAQAERMQKIRDIVAEVLEVEPSEISETSRFVEDHGADSLRAIEILSRLEKRFQLEIPQEELARMSSVGSTYEVLRETAHWSD